MPPGINLFGRYAVRKTKPDQERFFCITVARLYMPTDDMQLIGPARGQNMTFHPI